MLNSQFFSVFSPPSSNRLPTIQTPPIPPMSDFSISVEGVRKQLESLNPAKAAGPDEITACFLKNCAAEISPMLADFYQQSLEEGITPGDWKKANVAPVFKKGSRSLPSNYRPISLTSIPCKILEHIISSQINRHLAEHDGLSNLNHGFRRGMSCDSQLLLLSQDILGALELGQRVDMVILDFTRAFDKVPHDLLLQKLSHHGITGNIHKWITSWLLNRTQVVQVDGAKSDSVNVTSGVPQGSVLGPLLFLIFINDIHCNISSQLRLFADDTLVYRVIESDQDYQTLQNDLNKLTEWAKLWGMEFNVDKCYVMHIMSKYKKRHEVCIPYQMLGKDLTRVTNNPYLGVLFNENMSSSPHIQSTVAKAQGTLAFLS